MLSLFVVLIARKNNRATAASKSRPRDSQRLIPGFVRKSGQGDLMGDLKDHLRGQEEKSHQFWVGDGVHLSNSRAAG